MDYIILYVSASVYFLLACVFFSAASIQKPVLKYLFRFIGKVLGMLVFPAILVFFLCPWYGNAEVAAEWALYIMASALTMALVCSAISKVTKWNFI